MNLFLSLLSAPPRTRYELQSLIFFPKIFKLCCLERQFSGKTSQFFIDISELQVNKLNSHIYFFLLSEKNLHH